MHRVSAPLCALSLLIVMTGTVPVSGGAQEATPAATPGAKPQRPTQPATGPGGREARFGGVTRIEQRRPGQPLADYWLFVPRDPLPAGGVAAPDPPPLVIFLPGFSLNTPEPYLAWIEHLARRGAVVLFADYQDSGGDEAAFRRNLLADVQKAFERLGREGVAVDPSRVAVVGHSLGGALAVDYAAGAAAAELPVPAAVMDVAPSCVGCPPK